MVNDEIINVTFEHFYTGNIMVIDLIILPLNTFIKVYPMVKLIINVTFEHFYTGNILW